jgi:hypothetical protein
LVRRPALSLERRVEIGTGRVVIRDVLEGHGIGARPRLSGPHLAPAAGVAIPANGAVRIVKTVDLASGRVEVECG